jgi:ParB family chromosome partitioning protein
MAKRTGDARIAGRAQGAKPDAGPEAHKHIEAERSLMGALAVPIEQIIPDPDQPRKDRDQARLTDLAASIKEYGVLQPLLVREYGLLDDGRTQYMIVAGGRRYAASQQAGIARLPVVVRDTEGAMLRLTQLIENVQRQDLAPLEEARAFMEIMDAEGLSAEQLGMRLHISGQKVRDRLLVLGNQPIADAVQRGQMGTAVAAEVLRLPDEGQAQVTAIIDAGGTVDQPTVRALRDDLKAVGVANPRAKGGGRPRKEPPRDRAREPVEERDYQWSIDIEGVTASQVDRGEGVRGRGHEVLQAAVAPLDVTALDAVLAYGEDRGWSCAELARTIREWRLGATP